jgi:hypothetical protein
MVFESPPSPKNITNLVLADWALSPDKFLPLVGLGYKHPIRFQRHQVPSSTTYLEELFSASPDLYSEKKRSKT